MNQASASTTTVDIAVCTFQRPHIATTLQSIAAMSLPEGVTLRVIVADNDTEPSAQALVQRTASDAQLLLTYVHAPSGNISIARNACLAAATADYIAFIDDDQTVTPQWLEVILARALETEADVVLGPVRGVYPAGAPEWLIEGGFHDNLPAFVGGKLLTGYTGSTLIHRNSAAIQGLLFNLAYGVTGGEDTDYFNRAVTKGARIEYEPAAVVHEPVPAVRMRLYWLIKRRARYGQTHGEMLLRLRYRSLRAALAGAKATYSFAMMPVFFLNAVRWRYWLLRGVFHLNVTRTLLTGQNPA